MAYLTSTEGFKEHESLGQRYGGYGASGESCNSRLISAIGAHGALCATGVLELLQSKKNLVSQ